MLTLGIFIDGKWQTTKMAYIRIRHGTESTDCWFNDNLRLPKYCSQVLISGWWFGTFFIFPYIGFLIIPIDFHIFQRGSNHQPDIMWYSPQFLVHQVIQLIYQLSYGFTSICLPIFVFSKMTESQYFSECHRPWGTNIFFFQKSPDVGVPAPVVWWFAIQSNFIICNNIYIYIYIYIYIHINTYIYICTTV